MFLVISSLALDRETLSKIGIQSRSKNGPGRPHISSVQFHRLWNAPLGALAQLGEHLLCKQGVIGSIPIRSTRTFRRNGRCAAAIACNRVHTQQFGIEAVSQLHRVPPRDLHLQMRLVARCEVYGATSQGSVAQVVRAHA